VLPGESLRSVLVCLGPGGTEGGAPAVSMASFGVSGGAASVSVREVVEFLIVVADLLHNYK
jgi:hypothetical protein